MDSYTLPSVFLAKKSFFFTHGRVGDEEGTTPPAKEHNPGDAVLTQ
jgi:hypothetical protein